MESSSRDTGDLGFIHGREVEYMDGNTLRQPSQATMFTSTSTSNTNSSSSPSPSPTPISSHPKPLASSTSPSAPDSKSKSTTTPQAPIPPSNSFSNFPFSSTRYGITPKISITTTIDSLISNHQNRNVGLLLMTRDLVASPVEDFILGSPLEG